MHLGILLSRLDVGGTERQFVLLARGLARRGHRVRLIALFPGGELEAELAGSGVEREALLVERPGRPGLALPRLARTLAAALERDPPDVLYSGDYASNLLAAQVAPRLDVPVVWGVRQDGGRVGWKPRAFRMLARRLRGRVALAIANSRTGLERHAGLGYLPQRALVVPNGVDTDRFRPCPDDLDAGAWRASLGCASGDALVGMLARWDPAKDHATFLRAAALLAERREGVRFVCAVPEVGSVPAAARSLDAHPALRGRLAWVSAGARVTSLLRALDVLVSSSVTEGLSNSLVEALACGTPCAVTDVGDSARAVGQAGRVVPPRDARALAEAVAQLLDAPAAERARLAALARDRAEEDFALERLLERTEAALAGVARDPSGTRAAVWAP